MENGNFSGDPTAEPIQTAATQEPVSQPVNLDGGAAPQTQEPIQAAPITPPSLAELTGGLAASIDEISGWKAKANEYEGINSNEFLSKVIKLFSTEGIDGVSRFIDVQRFNPEGMADLDVIKSHLKASNPGFDDAMVEHLIAQQGFSIEDPTAAASRVALSKMKKEAISFFEAQKVAAEQPIISAQQAEANRATAMQSARAAVESYISGNQHLSVSVELPGVGTYSYEPTADEMNAVHAAMLNHFSTQTSTPTPKELESFKHAAFMAMNASTVLQHTAKTMYDAGFQAAIRKNSGPVPPGVMEGEVAKKTPPPNVSPLG